MTKRELQEAAINYAIDTYANNIRVAGIIGILEGLDISSISDLLIKTKSNNYMAINEILKQLGCGEYQSYKVITELEIESDIATMTVKHCYDNYRRTNK